MDKLILRDYQETFVADVTDAWCRHRAVIGWLPTGAGKTEIAVWFSMLEEDRGGCTLFVVDRKTLARQARERYSLKYGLLTGLIRGEDTYVRGYEPVLVATVQTLKARWDHPDIKQALERVTLVVVDEAHIQFKHHDEIIKHLPNARILGLSATPLREGLACMYGELVEGPSYEQLIEAKYLVRGRYFLPHTDDIVMGLKRMSVASTGDFVSDQLSQLMRRRTIIGDVVQTWKERAGYQSTICFCVDIAHSKEVCDAFLQANIPAEHIDLHTEEEDRQAMFQRFREGRTRVLCSIVILGVGFDEPIASCAILARPTLSLSMHIQQIGRVLRPYPGKESALILDHAGNALRHGIVETFSPPELSKITKHSDRKTKSTIAETFPCSECRALMSPGQRVCGECGHEIARQNTVDFIDGQLVEGDAPAVGMSDDRALQLYQELRGYGQSQGYKDGWAYMQLLNHYEFKAPFHWKRTPVAIPSQMTLNLVKSWNIAYWKAKQKEKRVARTF